MLHSKVSQPHKDNTSMQIHHRTVAAIATASLLAAFTAQANKGAVYHAPSADDFDRITITGGAMFLKPDLNGLDYLDITDISSGTGQTSTYSIDPDYQWGYYLAAGYMISDRYDVQASWTQLDTSDSDSATSDAGTFFATSNQFGSDLIATLAASSHETLNYQAFDGTLGQYHKLGENLMTRVFAGVRYAKITNNTTNDYSIAGKDRPLTDSDTFDSSFTGWGPELGLDVNYEVNGGFGIVAHFAAAFLMGEIDAESDVFLGSTVDTAVTNANEGTQMIPALDAKLGISLGVPFMDFMHRDDRFVLEAGYQVAYYFNVIDQIQNQVAVSSFNKTYAVTHNYSDLGIMGPYANLSVKF